MQVIPLSTKSSKFKVFFEFLKNNRNLLILVAVLIFGKLVGALSVKYLHEAYKEYVNDWFISLFQFRSTTDFWTLFLSNSLKSVAYIFIILFLSLGVSGVVIIPSVIFFRGLGSCALSGLLYREYSLQGIAYSNLILLPSSFALDIVLIMLACYSFDLSLKFTKIIKQNDLNQNDFKIDFIKTLRKGMGCLLSAIVISLADALFSIGFTQFFNFI